LNEVDFFAVVIDESLQEGAELVGVVDENLQNFFDFDWLLIRAVSKFWGYLLAASNPDYLTGNDLHMVHKSFLAQFHVWVGRLASAQV
jgi:hypothetical protein